MNNIHDVIELIKGDPKDISYKFGIPLRTVYSWCEGTRQPASYIINMMHNIILLERRLAEHGNEEERLEEGMGSNS